MGVFAMSYRGWAGIFRGGMDNTDWGKHEKNVRTRAALADREATIEERARQREEDKAESRQRADAQAKLGLERTFVAEGRSSPAGRRAELEASIRAGVRNTTGEFQDKRDAILDEYRVKYQPLAMKMNALGAPDRHQKQRRLIQGEIDALAKEEQSKINSVNAREREAGRQAGEMADLKRKQLAEDLAAEAAERHGQTEEARVRATVGGYGQEIAILKERQKTEAPARTGPEGRPRRNPGHPGAPAAGDGGGRHEPGYRQAQGGQQRPRGGDSGRQPRLHAAECPHAGEPSDGTPDRETGESLGG